MEIREHNCWKVGFARAEIRVREGNKKVSYTIECDNYWDFREEIGAFIGRFKRHAMEFLNVPARKIDRYLVETDDVVMKSSVCGVRKEKKLIMVQDADWYISIETFVKY